MSATSTGPIPPASPFPLRGLDLAEALRTRFAALRTSSDETATSDLVGECYALAWSTVMVAARRAIMQRAPGRADADDLAEDVAAEVFALLPSAVRRMQHMDQPVAWLRRVTLFTASRALQRESGRWRPGDRGRVYLSIDEVEQGLAGGPGDEWIAAAADAAEADEARFSSLAERLQDALAELKTAQPIWHRAVVLCRLERCSHAEIAAALGVSEGTSRNYVSNGIKFLKRAAGASEPEDADTH